MVVKKHPKDEIPDSLYSYLDMCQKAEDIPGNNHVFDKGDFFYHSDIGISTVDINLGEGSFYCTEQNLFDKKLFAKAFICFIYWFSLRRSETLSCPKADKSELKSA
jgi:hypothetical protein